MSDLKDPRVLFAAERTLLAWNRTSLSLIAFGFVMERAGILLKAISSSVSHAGQMQATFLLGLAFIFLGALTSLFSAYQYRQLLKTLTPAEFPPGYSSRWGLLVNVTIGVFGILLILALSFMRS
jgi:putative membrane protein